MKKNLVLMLVCTTIFSLSACSSNKEAKEEKAEKSEDTVTEKKEDTKEDDTQKEASSDVAHAINMKDSSSTPAKLNQWMKTTLYSTVDKLNHTVYIRMTKITTASDDEAYVNEAIEIHNSFEQGSKAIDVNELKLPADGSTSYIGLGSGDFLTTADSEQKYEPGNTYQMKGYFPMVKGFKDYYITSSSYPDGATDGLVDCIWASH